MEKDRKADNKTIWALGNVLHKIFSAQSLPHFVPTHFIILRVALSHCALGSGFIQLPTSSYTSNTRGRHSLCMELPISIYTRCLSLPGSQLYTYLQLVARFEMVHPLISQLLLARGKGGGKKSQGVPF